MRKIRIIEFISLDGVIQAPGGPGEDGDYPYGGWTVPHSDAAVGEAIIAAHGKDFDLLLGRHTYDIWSGYWPGQYSGGRPSSHLAPVTGRRRVVSANPRELEVPVSANTTPRARPIFTPTCWLASNSCPAFGPPALPIRRYSAELGSMASPWKAAKVTSRRSPSKS
jgi:hypothetical protein